MAIEDHPVNAVRWVPIEQVFANGYNPNVVAPIEMRLLARSILEDGYTQPCVCYHDRPNDMYIIVDGFHRYRCCKEIPEIREATGGYLPVVVIDKPLSNRMASTVRHNRARGTHKIAAMAELVSQLFLSGWTNKRIKQELGMDDDEVNRLKQFTGLGRLFAGHTFSKAESDEVENTQCR